MGFTVCCSRKNKIINKKYERRPGGNRSPAPALPSWNRALLLYQLTQTKRTFIYRLRGCPGGHFLQIVFDKHHRIYMYTSYGIFLHCGREVSKNNISTTLGRTSNSLLLYIVQFPLLPPLQYGTCLAPLSPEGFRTFLSRRLASTCAYPRYTRRF